MHNSKSAYIWINKKLKKMKKVILLSLSLFIAGTMFADKKCCKDKASCSKKEAKASCSKDEKKACCKKSSEGSTVSADMAATSEAHACCKKKIAEGGKACCAAKTTATTAPKAAAATR